MDNLHKKCTTFSCRESCLQEGQLELLSLFLIAPDYKAFNLLLLLLHSPTFSDKRQTLGSDQNLGRIPNTSFSIPLPIQCYLQPRRAKEHGQISFLFNLCLFADSKPLQPCANNEQPASLSPGEIYWWCFYHPPWQIYFPGSIIILMCNMQLPEV